jgi:pimeloyl-ACP methyl ester carboxylesterase
MTSIPGRGTVPIDGTAIYHEVHGVGDPVLLLHGGFSSIEAMRPQLDALAAAGFAVYAPERAGHGRSADEGGAFSYARSVAQTLAYLDAVGVEAPHVVGFSDGAIIGLLLALELPRCIRSLVAISGNLDPSGFVAEGAEGVFPAGEGAPDRSREIYGELSPDGPEHADVVLAKLMELWTTEPHIERASLARIAVPVLVMAGDRDVIALDHSRLMATSIPRGQLCIVPGAGHGLLDEREAFVTFAVREFLAAQ